MKQVVFEVPRGTDLLKKSNRITVWLKLLIGPLERKILESHTSITLMNDIIHSSLKIYSFSFIPFTSPFLKFVTPQLTFLLNNLTDTELMRWIACTKQYAAELNIEANN